MPAGPANLKRVRVLVVGFLVAAGLFATAGAALAQGSGREARAARLRAMGQAFRAAGDPGSATGYFRDAIRVHPDDPEAYVALGQIYLERGSASDALEVLSAGIRRRPDHGPLWRGLATVLEERGALGDAAEALRQLAQRAPDDPAAHVARAELARRRGAWSEALGAYRRVVDLAASGTAVEPEMVAEARRYVAALAILVGGVDPVRGAACDDPSAVRRALAQCP